VDRSQVPPGDPHAFGGDHRYYRRPLYPIRRRRRRLCGRVPGASWGQNILEPAAWGRVPIYGPNLENFLWAKQILEEADAGIVVNDASSLAQTVRHLLDFPKERQEVGRRAQAALVPHQGAARRQAELIAALAQKV